MELRVVRIAPFFCLFMGCFLLGSQQTPLSLEQRIKKIIKPIPGQMGVAALHIESGKHVEVNGDVRFPMGSTYKLPTALYCLSLVDRGILNFDTLQNFVSEDLRRGESDFFTFSAQCLSISSAKQLSVRQIMQVMLQFSSNTATDKMFKLIGGPKKVTQWLRSDCHIDQMSVDRTTMKMRADYSGIKLEDDYRCNLQHYNSLYNKVSKEKYRAANKVFFDDKRDTTTPCAMVDLLARMYQGKLVSATSTKFLVDTMSNCHLFGKGRIVRMLPKKCKVLHKTGRMDGMVSDVGIIELPHGKGHVAIALYSNKSTTHEAQRELAMAKITKMLYDHFSV